MTTFVLIHGMWHGGWRWDKLSALLRGGGTEEDGRWFHHAIDSAGIVRAIDEGAFAATGSFPLYLTFARKPA